MRRGALLLPLAVAAVFVTACTGHAQQAHAPSAAAPAPAAATTSGAPVIGAAADGCAGQPPISSLPAWARSGFTPPDLAMPHVTGAAGSIVAILWQPKNALHTPPLPNAANKILWVSKVPSGAPLVIHATLAGSTRTATVSLPDGPGPSYVNMPALGCWTLHLSWGGQSDEIMLRYTS
jgi:hypothetical protein